MLICEWRAGASDSCLYLINNQQDIVLCAKLLQFFYKCRLSSNDTAFPLNDLQHNRRGLPVDFLFHSFYIIKWHIIKCFKHRSESLLHFILPCCCHCRKGSAVE